MGAIEPLVFDVRPLLALGRPPLAAILQQVNSLEDGQALVLLAPFEPKPLYTLLEERGYGAEAVELPDGTWEIRFEPLPRP